MTSTPSWPTSVQVGSAADPATTDRVESRGIGLATGFVKSCEARPDARALVHGGCVWTYEEIFSEARRWAAVLIEEHVRLGQPVVGILAGRGPIEHIGKLAALLAGCVFVPLNPKFPVDRLAEMARQAHVSTLIADSGSASTVLALYESVSADISILLPDGVGKSLKGRLTSPVFDAVDLANRSPLPTTEIAAPGATDLAYIMFTSGSSGKPKGVPITHGNLRAFLSAVTSRHEFHSEDIFALTFDSTFDLSIFGPFVAWEVGATAITMSSVDLTNAVTFISDNGVTVWLSVPSVAKTLEQGGALAPGLLPTLSYSFFCGEALPQHVAVSWQQAAPNSLVVNMYGPTEATIFVTEFPWDPLTSPDNCVNGVVPIGHPYAEHSTILIDSDGSLIRTGRRGELCIAGPQVFGGYLDADAALNSPFLTVMDGNELRTYYKTGDICQRLGDGTLVYIARADQQVKISGYRVELGDVEAGLRRAGAREAIAVPWPADEPRGLVAVVAGGVLDRDALGSILPPYMVPHTIYTLDQMPLNANGKIDRRKVQDQVVVAASKDASNAGSTLSVDEIRSLVAHALGEHLDSISEHAQLHNPASWDSLGHNSVVAALEDRLATSIRSEHDHQLRSISGIVEFVNGRTASRNVDRSLRGLLVTESAITNTDVSSGGIFYRGYSITDLVDRTTFEDVAFLILNGELPTSAESAKFRDDLVRRRAPSSVALDVLGSCADVNSHPLAALTTAVCILGAELSGVRNGLRLQSVHEAREAGIDLIAQLPTLTSAYIMLRSGRQPIAPDPQLSHIENLLRMLDVPVTDRNVQALTKDFIIHADNGPTASTFACMVANSAHTTVHAAVAAAASVFSGARHGYASETAYSQLVPLKDGSAVRSYVTQRLEKGELLDGIGHAIFGRTGDPRLAPYREVATDMAIAEGNVLGLEKATAMYDASLARKNGAHPNYDLFGGLLYESMGLPIDISAPLHVCFRAVGWIAHIIEERNTGQPLIRPEARYVGPSSRRLPERDRSTTSAGGAA